MKDVFGDCDRCSLQDRCARGQVAFAQSPDKPFNGLMIVGEGPGRQEIVSQKFFVGPSGKLLRALLGSERIDMDACFITNATLGKPALGMQLMKNHVDAIHACLGRLEQEIAAVRPRVILALGGAAMAALTGYERKFERQDRFDCEYCAESLDDKGKVDRKVFGIKCSQGTCGHIWEAPEFEPKKPSGSWKPVSVDAGEPAPRPSVRGSVTSETAAAEVSDETAKRQETSILQILTHNKEYGAIDKELEAALGIQHEALSARRRGLVLKKLVGDSGLVRKTPSNKWATVWALPQFIRIEKPEKCPKCDCNWKRLKVRRVACPSCKGRKTKVVEHTSFEWDYKISESAGAVLDAEKFGWADLGVKYIIPTFHPAFLLRPPPKAGSGENKVMAGQFAAKSVQRHMRKAGHLLENDVEWAVEYETAGSHWNEDKETAAQHLFDYIYEQPLGTEFTWDLETEAKGLAYYCLNKRETVRREKLVEIVCSKRSNVEAKLDGPKQQTVWCKECESYQLMEGREVDRDARIPEQVSTVTCMGFYAGDCGLVVDTRDMKKGDALFKAVRKVLEDPDVRIVPHHGTYDMPVAWLFWGIDVKGYSSDTLIQHHVLCPDETHSLSHLAFRYTYARLWKPPKQLRGRDAHESYDELVLYNARDVKVTHEAREAMAAELVRKGMEDVLAMDMQLQHQGLDMQFNGMPLDLEAAKTVGAEAMERRAVFLFEMRDVLKDPDFNPNKQLALREALYDKLGYVAPLLTKGGADGKNKKPSTAQEALLRLEDSPFKRSLLGYRESNTILGNFFEIRNGKAHPSRGLNLWSDGRIHVTWKPFGTRTGRYSSSPNLQNWKKWLRAMIVAPEGRKIIGADYDQLELRIIAALCGDEKLIDLCLHADETRKLEPDYDPHSFVANLAFGSEYTKLDLTYKNHDTGLKAKCKCDTCSRKWMRDVCKRVIYGMNYGAGDEKVLESIYNAGWDGIPLSVATIGQIRKAIYRAFKKIKPWREAQVRLANERSALYSPLLGRHRVFPLHDVPVTETYNFPIQTGGADIINQRNAIFYNDYQLQIDPTSLYIAQGHDAVYYEVAEEKAEEFAAKLTEVLSWETALYKGGPVLPFTAKAVVADNWRDAA